MASKSPAVTSASLRKALAGAVATALLLTLLVLPQPERASAFSGNGVANESIANLAMNYVNRWGGDACVDAGRSGYNGSTPGGQTHDGLCKAFVVCVVLMLTGRWVGNDSPSYQTGFPREGAIEVRPDEAQRGDIFMIGATDGSVPLHAGIIWDRIAGQRFQVIDSNFRPDEKVRFGTLVIPTYESHIWRMGQVPSGRNPSINGNQGSILGPIGPGSQMPSESTPIDPQPYPAPTTTTTAPPTTTTRATTTTTTTTTQATTTTAPPTTTATTAPTTSATTAPPTSPPTQPTTQPTSTPTSPPTAPTVTQTQPTSPPLPTFPQPTQPTNPTTPTTITQPTLPSSSSTPPTATSTKPTNITQAPTVPTTPPNGPPSPTTSPPAASTPPATTAVPSGAPCLVSSTTGGPWSDVYNQSLTVTNTTSSTVNYVRLTIQLPTGHSIVNRWNDGNTGLSLPMMAFGPFAPDRPVTNSGFQVRMASGADASARPVVRCEVVDTTVAVTTSTTSTTSPATAPTVAPTTAQPATGNPVCSVNVRTSGPWGDVYNQVLDVTVNNSPTTVNNVEIFINVPSGQSITQRWYTGLNNTYDADPSRPMIAYGPYRPGVAVTNAGFQLRINNPGSSALRPTITCAAVGIAGVPAPTPTAPSVPPTVPPTQGTVCAAQAVRGGPWSDLYNETFTITNLTTSALPAVKLTIQLPAGHTYAYRWFGGKTGEPDMNVPMIATGPFYPGTPVTNAGFQGRVAPGANPALRPVVTCSAA